MLRHYTCEYFMFIEYITFSEFGGHFGRHFENWDTRLYLNIHLMIPSCSLCQKTYIKILYLHLYHIYWPRYCTFCVWRPFCRRHIGFYTVMILRTKGNLIFFKAYHIYSRDHVRFYKIIHTKNYMSPYSTYLTIYLACP